MANKTYRGDRTIDGAQVTVDGQELDPRLDLHTFTDHGIEWSYEGDGPRQLALAMLAVHFGDDSKALTQCESFMSRIVANFGNEWEMTSKDIDNALANISADA
jgi:hypothetical protein